MKINNIYLSFLQAERFMKILLTVFKHSIIRVFGGSTLSIKESKRGIKGGNSTPERFRLLVEELGPTFVKFGQILADRPDILPEEYRFELRKLQSGTKPFKTQFAIDIIEHELGKSVNELFDNFDPIPQGSASIGQVYIAYLKSGEKVVVKVQRPNIRDTIKLDLKLLRFFAQKIAKRNPDLDRLNIVGVVDNFSETIFYELDYLVEQNNIDIFRDMFKGSCTVHIPKTYPKYTTSKVLVMQHMEGLFPNQSEEIDRRGINRNVVMRNGAEAIFKMILDYGIYHADPHSGNILVQDDGSVIFLDFGMIGVLRKRELDFIAQYAMGYSRRDEALITKAFLDLCNEKFFSLEEDLKFDIKKMLLRNFNRTTMDIETFSNTLQDTMYLVIKYRLSMPTDVFLLIKTTIILERFSKIMGVDIDLTSIILPYSEKIINEKLSVKRIVSKIQETLLNYLEILQTSPRDVAEILYKIKQGKIIHEVNIERSEQFLVSIRKISLRIAYVLVLCGVFIGSSIMYVVDYGHMFVTIALYSSLAMIIALVLKWLFFK